MGSRYGIEWTEDLHPPKTPEELATLGAMTEDELKMEFDHQEAHIDAIRIEARIATAHLAAIMESVVPHGIPREKFRDWVKGSWDRPKPYTPLK